MFSSGPHGLRSANDSATNTMLGIIATYLLTFHYTMFVLTGCSRNGCIPRQAGLSNPIDLFYAQAATHHSYVLLLCFGLCGLVLRVGSTFWFYVLLIEDISCVLPREDSAYFKTWLRFVSRLGCILSQDFPHFVSRPPAFCLKTWLRFVSRPPAFCLKTYCVLSQDSVAFCLKTWLRFVSRPLAFCLKTYCVLSQDLLRVVSRLLAFCLHLKTFFCVLGNKHLTSRVTQGHLYPFNHYTDAKDIWDNVKMLLKGSELTKEDRESQLYDDFEHFRQHKGETIHDYYVQFAKLINDMRNIKMTMSRMQLNSKFVNNMLPEWGGFMTAVKLNRGLRDSNYNQLYAYLKQHVTHANENKMMLDRFSQHIVDPLALMSNVSHKQHYSQSSSTPPFTYVPPHLADNAHHDSGLSSTDNLIKNVTNTLALLTQSYKTFLPQTNNQLRTSSNTRNHDTVQDGRVVV
nr:integrase, catalytic region, zinc finger, CCHC-type, peptidase aspartic, catalytic [Tanacetum cinerariifolium]